MAEKFDVVVIGSGPGGYSAAIRCVQQGSTVAIVEKDFIGGTCLNRGCVPSKALLASAKTLLDAKNAGAMGVDVGSVSANWAKIQARKNAIVTGFRKGLTGLIGANKIKVFPGKGVAVAPKQVKVEGRAEPIDIETEKIILATGSQAVAIPSIPFDGRTVLTNKEALSLEQIPASMVIIGGGVLGCEMACVYAAVGTKVTIVEALDRLLPMEDEWIGKLVAREFKKLGIESLVSQKVTSVDAAGNLAKVLKKPLTLSA